MVDTKALAVAAVVHFLFRFSIFIKFVSCPSQIKDLPSILTLMTILMYLADNDIIPRRYSQRGIAWVMFLLETVASLFVIEVAMILIWSKIELVVEFAIYQALDSKTYSSWGGTLANVLVLTFAAVNFCSMAYMTNHMDVIINQITRWKTSIQELFTQRRQGQAEGAQICVPLRCTCVPMSQAPNGQLGIPQAHSTVNDQREQISAQQVRPTTSTGIRNGNQGGGDTQQASTRQRLVPQSSHRN